VQKILEDHGKSHTFLYIQRFNTCLYIQRFNT